VGRAIDSRLQRLGWAPTGVRVERLREFAATFPMLGGRTEEAFERFFGATALTHADLVRFALAPERVLGGSPRAGTGPGSRARCAACRPRVRAGPRAPAPDGGSGSAALPEVAAGRRSLPAVRGPLPGGGPGGDAGFFMTGTQLVRFDLDGDVARLTARPR
jgi:hypothetical protein